jgi:hypothetical protein
MVDENTQRLADNVQPVVEPLTGKDEDAPYGRKADGTPRDKPGRRPGQKTGTGSRPRPRQTARAAVDYETPLLGLFQLPAGVLAIAGMQKPVFAADAGAITIHAPHIAKALHDLAQERPEIAGILDRVLQVGPYGVLIAAIAPLVLQILTNHGALPPGMLGTIPPEQLIASFVPAAESPNPNGERRDGDSAEPV